MKTRKCYILGRAGRVGCSTLFAAAVAVCAPVAKADLLYSENFNSVPTNGIPAGWSVSTLLPAANTRDGDVKVVELKSSTDKSLRLLDDSTIEGRHAIRSFEALENAATIYWDIRVSQTTMKTAAYLMNRQGRQAVRVSFEAGGDVYAYNGGTNTLVGSYSANTWYTLRVALNLLAGTYDFYIGSTKVADDFAFYESAGNEVSAIKFWTRTAHTGTAYIDLLRVYGAPTDVISQSYGAPSTWNGQPLGGGSSTVAYSGGPTRSQANYIVSTTSGLTSALTNATSGSIIWVENTANILLNSAVTLNAGVTLASGRGQSSSGGRIYSTNTTDGFRMILMKDNARITGLRIEGPDGSTSATEVAAIHAFDNVEVDNCYIYNWGFAGIHCKSPTGTSRPYNSIHHNLFRYIRKSGLGYPVEFGPRAGGIVEGNVMEFFRHAIAHWGDPTDFYIFRGNRCGTGTSFAADMHTMHEQGGRPKLEDDPDNEYHVAGDYVMIYRNTFQDGVNRAIKIRGMPNTGAFIYGNYFAAHNQTNEAIAVDNSEGNMFIERNKFNGGTIKIGENYRLD